MKFPSGREVYFESNDKRTNSSRTARVSRRTDGEKLLACLIGLILNSSQVMAQVSVPEGFEVELLAAGIEDPGDLSFGPSGALFVGNEGAGDVQIYRVDIDGNVTTFGDPIFDPDVVLALESGEVLAGGMGTIFQISSDGASTSVFSSDTEVGNIGGFLMSTDGDLLATNFNLDTLIQIEEDGSAQNVVTGLQRPTGMAQASDGSIFVIRFVAGAIAKINTAGEILDPSFATGLEDPAYLAFGPGGLFGNDLFVTEADSGVVSRLDSSGNKMVFASGFNRPIGITFGPDGNMYISDFSAGEIIKICPASTPLDIPSLGTAQLFFLGLLLAICALWQLNSRPTPKREKNASCKVDAQPRHLIRTQEMTNR